MATDPRDHPLHQVPEELPRPPGDLPPAEPPPLPPHPSEPGGTGANPYAGEIEDEAGDPVGKPPRL